MDGIDLFSQSVVYTSVWFRLSFKLYIYMEISFQTKNQVISLPVKLGL
jgi:hypothetical protein